MASDDRAQHEASLLLMRNRFDIAASERILAIWAEHAGSSEPRPVSGMASGR